MANMWCAQQPDLRTTYMESDANLPEKIVWTQVGWGSHNVQARSNSTTTNVHYDSEGGKEEQGQ